VTGLPEDDDMDFEPSAFNDEELKQLADLEAEADSTDNHPEVYEVVESSMDAERDEFYVEMNKAVNMLERVKLNSMH